MADESDKIRESAKETAELVQDAFRSIAASIPALFAEAMEAADDSVRSFNDTLQKDVTKSINQIAKVSDTLIKNELLLQQGKLKSADIDKQKMDLSAKVLGISRALEISQKAGLLTEEERLKKEAEIKDQVKLITAELDKQQKLANQMANKTRFFDVLASTVKQIPILGKALSGPFQQASTAAQNAAGQGKSMFGVMKAGLAGLGKGISEQFTVTAVFGFLLKQLFEINKATVALQKNMNLSAGEAAAFHDEITDAAVASKDMAISHTKLLKAQSALSEQTGIFNLRAGETLITFSKLVDKIGISAESAAKLEMRSKLTGANFEQQRKATAAIGVNLGRQNGLNLSGKKILEEVGKTTGQVAANLGNNPELIAEAVAQAQILGTSLDKVAKIASQIIDFEKSIGDELEAELLVGRDLNLERARALALAGDQAGLAEELATQVGSLTEFQALNVIQQEKLAQAFGMNADEMANMLEQQEYQNLTAEELRDIGQEELARNMEQRDLQQQMADLMEKISTVIVNIAEGPLGKIAGFFGDMLSSTTGMYATLGFVATLMAGKFIIGIMKTITAMRQLKKLEIGSAIAKGWNAAMSAGPLSFFGGLAIGAAITGAILGAVALADDMVSPGYGKRTLFSPEGAIALNDNDTVIAGTNLFPAKKGDDVVSSPAGSIQVPDLTPPPPPPPQQQNIQVSVNMDPSQASDSITSFGGYSPSIA